MPGSVDLLTPLRLKLAQGRSRYDHPYRRQSPRQLLWLAELGAGRLQPHLVFHPYRHRHNLAQPLLEVELVPHLGRPLRAPGAQVVCPRVSCPVVLYLADRGPGELTL